MKSQENLFLNQAIQEIPEDFQKADSVPGTMSFKKNHYGKKEMKFIQSERERVKNK